MITVKTNSLLLVWFSIFIFEKTFYAKTFDDYFKDSTFFSVNLDLNHDGILDKVFSHKPYKGDELYFFLNTSSGYQLVYEGVNFSEDGGNTIKSVTKNTEGKIVIETFFPDRGHYIERFFISYKKSNHWQLEYVEYESIVWQEDYTKTNLCHVNVEAELNGSKIDWRAREKEKKCTARYLIEDDPVSFEKKLSKIGTKQEGKFPYKGVGRYSTLLEKHPLKKSNVTSYNNMAYYLQKRKAYDESKFLLEKIVDKYPSRTVAYLNLGDTYWGLKKKKKAIKVYETYVKQMIEKGKEKRIPQETLKRLETEATKKGVGDN